MRDYGKVSPQFWTDYRGRVWPTVQSRRRLKFKYPLHAALREHVFNRDGFKCCRCDARAINVPQDWDGATTLQTDTKVRGLWADCLVVDHILTLAAGGLNVIENFQTLCETCNRRKQREDKAAIAAFKAEAI